MLKRIALCFRMRRWNVWERLLLWRSSVYWGVNSSRETWTHRDLPEGRTSSVHSIQYHDNISWGDSDFGSADSDQPLLYHWQRKINPSFMQMSESCEPTTSQHSTCGPNQKLCLQFSLSLSHPIGRIVSQSQSWLSLPRPNKSSTYLLTLIRLCPIKQRSELIKTMCNVTVEQSKVE